MLSSNGLCAVLGMASYPPPHIPSPQGRAKSKALEFKLEMLSHCCFLQAEELRLRDRQGLANVTQQTGAKAKPPTPYTDPLLSIETSTPVKSCHLEVELQLKTSQEEWFQLTPQHTHGPSAALNTIDRKCLFKGNLEILPREEKHIILAYDRSWSIKLPLSLCDVRTLLVFHPLPLSTHCFCPSRQLSPASIQDGARGHFQTGGCTDMPASEYSGNSSDPWRGRSR